MFAKLAKTIAANAANYRTQTACHLALHRVRAAWRRAGGYGNVKYLLDDAVWACQLRWVTLEGERLNAKYGDNYGSDENKSERH